MKFNFVVFDTSNITYIDEFNIESKDILLTNCLYKIVNDYIEIEDKYIEDRVGIGVLKMSKSSVLFLDSRHFVCDNYESQKFNGDVVYSVNEWVIKSIIE